MNLHLNLQLFSEEKTEKATPKKKQDARKKGQVPVSKELNASFSLLMAFVAIDFLKGYMGTHMMNIMAVISNSASHESLDTIFYEQGIYEFLGYIFQEILLISIPILVIVMISGTLVSFAQVGSLFSLDPIKPKFSKINPLKGMKNLFSMRSIVEFAKSVLKSAIMLAIAFDYVNKQIPTMISTFDLNPINILAVMWDIVFNIGIRCSLVLFVIAIFDYAYKRWQNEKDLRMSKKEIKDEYKEMEGDPQLKAKIKEKQREFAMSRMMQEVPSADVVITNPTHFAVAIRYESGVSEAPMVIAKGQDLIAKNIKRIAGENEVPIVENKPLARTLFATVEVGEPISPELYEAVAEVLAYVYKLKQ